MSISAVTETDPAPGVVFQRIIRADVESGHQLKLEFADGFVGRVDVSTWIRQNAVTAPLAHQDFVRKVRVGDKGRTLEWPGGLEFCADALRLRADGRL